MMSKPAIRVLVVEDNPLDFLLVQREFSKAGLAADFQQTETDTQFVEALQTFDPHLVISDFDLPSFNALQALAILQAYRPSVPFVLLTGVLSESVAGAMLNLGVSVFLLKKDMDQLMPSISRLLPNRETAESQLA